MIEFVNSLLSEQLAYAISWTLVHSLWQASLIALIMSWFLNRYKHEDAVIRYRISYAALVFVFFGSVLTFLFYYSFNVGVVDEVVQQSYAVTLLGASNVESGNIISQMGSWLSHNLELFASMWVLGVILFSVKLGGSYVFASQLKKQNTDFIPDNIYKGFVELKNKLGIQQYVHLAESSKVNTPMLIGYLKPVILFPIGLINHLSVEETQAILAHELAHIKRNDFLHNLILSVVEMLFYYHPAVWWISANVRMERENCCDDLAMKLIGDKTIYAKTLLKIEELKTAKIPSLAIPLSRNKNQLLHRISRIVNQPQTRSQIRERFIATCLLFTFFFGFGSTAMDHNMDHYIVGSDLDQKIVTNIIKDCDKQLSQTNLKLTNEKGDCNCNTSDKRFVNVSVSNVSTEDRDIIYIDTIPSGKKSNMTIINSADDQEVILKMKDGKIIELTVDGEEVDEDDYDEHLSQSADVEELIEEAQEQAELLSKNFSENHSKRFEDHLKNKNFLHKLDDEGKWIVPDHLNGLNLNELKKGKLLNEELMKELSEVRKLNKDFHDKIEFDVHDKHFELLEKLKNSEFPHANFDNGVHFNDSMRFVVPNIDSIFDHDFRNGIVEFDSSMPRIHEFEFDVPHFEEFHLSLRNPTDKLMHALSQDGFIDANRKNTIELTGKYLKINGEKQPSNIFKKYKKMFEESVGHPLTKNSKFRFEYDKKDLEKLKIKIGNRI